MSVCKVWNLGSCFITQGEVARWSAFGIRNILVLPCIEKAASETYPVLDSEKEKTEPFFLSFSLDQEGHLGKGNRLNLNKKKNPHEMLKRNNPTNRRLHCTQHSQPSDTPVTTAAAAVSAI
jgi:hypothetical protein